MNFDYYLYIQIPKGKFLKQGTGSALSFFLQAWCISQRGPVFSAMFNPVCTIFGAILDALFLHEAIYTGT